MDWGGHVFPLLVIMVGVALRIYGHEEVGKDLMFGGFALFQASPIQLALSKLKGKQTDDAHQS